MSNGLLVRVGPPGPATGRSRRQAREILFWPQTMVLLRWDLNGERFEERIPVQWARRRRQELERLGAVVYWSERLAAAA